MRKKVIIGVVCIVAVAIVCIGGRNLLGTLNYKKIISDIEIKTPDIAKIQDGVYNGSFDALLVSAEVDVVVEGERITDIIIKKHKNGRGAKAEAITEEVVNRQSLEVDAVTGATNSSKVILKAIENALTT